MPLPRRTLLDRVIHYRVEPDVNAGAPDDERDTTTPSALAADLRKLALGDGLDTAGRNLLVNWMRSATTGLDLVRAGVTKDWAAADKSGSGDRGEPAGALNFLEAPRFWRYPPASPVARPSGLSVPGPRVVAYWGACP